MFRVYKLELRQGADAAAFERAMPGGIPAIGRVGGMKAYLLKGDRVEREGRHPLVLEIESVETRDRHVPVAGQHASDEFSRATPGLFELLGRYLVRVPSSAYTDYVEIGRQSRTATPWTERAGSQPAWRECLAAPECRG